MRKKSKGFLADKRQHGTGLSEDECDRNLLSNV
jgi:hypothetical protein